MLSVLRLIQDVLKMESQIDIVAMANIWGIGSNMIFLQYYLFTNKLLLIVLSNKPFQFLAEGLMSGIYIFRLVELKMIYLSTSLIDFPSSITSNLFQ